MTQPHQLVLSSAAQPPGRPHTSHSTLPSPWHDQLPECTDTCACAVCNMQCTAHCTLGRALHTGSRTAHCTLIQNCMRCTGVTWRAGESGCAVETTLTGRPATPLPACLPACRTDFSPPGCQLCHLPALHYTASWQITLHAVSSTRLVLADKGELNLTLIVCRIRIAELCSAIP